MEVERYLRSDDTLHVLREVLPLDQVWRSWLLGIFFAWARLRFRADDALFARIEVEYELQSPGAALITVLNLTKK